MRPRWGREDHIGWQLVMVVFRCWTDEVLGNCFIVGFIYNSYISVKNIIMCIYIYTLFWGSDGDDSCWGRLNWWRLIYQLIRISDNQQHVDDIYVIIFIRIYWEIVWNNLNGQMREMGGGWLVPPKRSIGELVKWRVWDTKVSKPFIDVHWWM